MKISFRIFLGFILLLTAAYLFMTFSVMKRASVQPKKAMEESMVDMAYILASFLEERIVYETIPVDSLKRFLDEAGKKIFIARIFEMKKTSISMGVYVTDKKGKVLFDSLHPERVGKDFSNWFDVKRTLAGKYGARTTRDDRDDNLSSVAYVGAPIYYNSDIIGVCTVYKPWKSINLFVQASHKKTLMAAAAGFIIIVILSFIISRWISRDIRKLTEYAYAVKSGVRVGFPRLGSRETREFGDAFESMWDSLDSKAYIEKYIQTLTHQLKGPLSAIRGAGELLEEDLPEDVRHKFIANINSESMRMQRIVERMLELASLEQQRKLRNIESIDLNKLIEEIASALAIAMEKKQIVFFLNREPHFYLKGERFLLYQALYNLIHNAIDFTPRGGIITVELKRHWDRLVILINDSGPGIPKYALGKIFDKFYSLPRPGSTRKSSGLGLALVKEVADLHQGQISLTNQPQGGAQAILKLPFNQ